MKTDGGRGQLSRRVRRRDSGDKIEKLKAEIGKELMPLREWQDNQFNHEKAKQEYEKVSRNLEMTVKAGVEEVALLQLKRDQAQVKIKAIEDNLNALQVMATTSGTVLYENAPMWNRSPNDPPRKFQVGDQVYPGFVVMTVPDLSEMEVRIFVSEVDESDGTIDSFSPAITVAVNLDWDHPDHYRRLDDLEATFAALFARTCQAVLVNVGISACSITRCRGSTSDAISASPNRSSRLQTLRSIGSSQARPRRSKYPLISAASIRESSAAA